MLFPQLLLTLLLLAICSFAPGYFLVRRLPWSGLEKLCGSIALSLILLWLAVWGIYVLAPWAQPHAYFGIVAVCCAAGIVSWRDARALFRAPRVRRALAGYGFLLAWTVLILAIVRDYSGGIWGGDWLEHFQRTLFFLHHFPKDTPIYYNYTLPARPPMMNVLAALYLGLTADRFEIFQLVFTFLNLLLFLPCCLAIGVVAPVVAPLMAARVRKASILPLAAIFAMNPAVMQNATYTWTKLLTAFFVIFAVCLYLAGWRRRDSMRMIAAFVALAAGLLVHYSAGPYCVFFALHYLLAVFRTRPNRWRELAAIAVACSILLLAWFGWSAATYGTKATFASNTTLHPIRQYQGNALGKIAGNLYDSIVPIIVQSPDKVHLYDQAYRPAMVRDVAFGIYQANVIFIMGLTGGPLAIWFLIEEFRGGRLRGAERWFWLWLIGFSLISGIAVSGERDVFGVGHLTLIPMEALGLTLLSTQFFRRRPIAFAILAGCAFDFGLGVFFHARIQHLENTPAHQYHTGLGVKGGQFLAGVAGADLIGGSAWRNWFAKRQFNLCREWLQAEEQFRPGDPTLEVGRAGFRKAMREKLNEDERYWRGWYRVHGGEIVFLGDWFGGSDVPAVLLALAAVGVLWKLAKLAPVSGSRVSGSRVSGSRVSGSRVSESRVSESRVSAPPAAAKPRSSRSRHKR